MFLSVTVEIWSSLCKIVLVLFVSTPYPKVWVCSNLSPIVTGTAGDIIVTTLKFNEASSGPMTAVQFLSRYGGRGL